MQIAELYEIYLAHRDVQTDTRKLNNGSLFFALKGPSFNGNHFAKQAIDIGAAYAIVDEMEYVVNARCILVEDVLDTLQQLALHHRKQLNIPFIAITGSNGKTTTKELATTVLQQRFKTYATVGNLNNHIGVPLTILSIGSDAEIAVIEMGANHQKEIESYCKISLPTHALITNCGKAHIEGFGGEEGVRKGKGELYDFIRQVKGVIFRNTDLPYLEDMAVGIAHQITYGSANAKYIGMPIMEGMMLHVAMLSSMTETTICSQLVGKYNFANIMSAVAIGLHFGITIDIIKTAIEGYTPDNSRSQLIAMGNNKVILDAYNANPTSMKAAIANFASIDADKKLLWLGGMKEMGEDEIKEHDDLIAFLSTYQWEEVLLVGAEFKRDTQRYKWFATSAAAAEYVQLHLPEQATILIKGSRGSKMELLKAALE